MPVPLLPSDAGESGIARPGWMRGCPLPSPFNVLLVGVAIFLFSKKSACKVENLQRVLFRTIIRARYCGSVSIWSNLEGMGDAESLSDGP